MCSSCLLLQKNLSVRLTCRLPTDDHHARPTFVQPRIAISSFNLRRLTSALPITIGRQTITLPTASQEKAVNASATDSRHGKSHSA